MNEPPLQKKRMLETESATYKRTTTTFSLVSYNILASGFTSPFKNTPSLDLLWTVRRKKIIDILLSYSTDVICLQELQSSTRGWGRSLTGKDLEGPDHAQQIRVLLGNAGYDGCYQVVDDDSRSSDSAAKNDISWTAGKDSKRNSAWPVEGTPGSRIGNAIFWKKPWVCIAQRPVLFSSVFMDLTKAKGDTKAWFQVKGMQVALIVLLKNKAVEDGPLICVCNVHLPVPGNVKKATLQVQYAEALIVEAETMLQDLNLLSHVPIIITGDFNSTQPGYKDGSLELNEHEGSPVYQLFTKGSLEGNPTLTAEFPLPFPNPTCGSLGKFMSAYAVINGSEPRFTNFRMVYDEKLLETHVDSLIKAEIGEEDVDPLKIEQVKSEILKKGLKDVPGETKFCACLDYIFYRQPEGISEGSRDSSRSSSSSSSMSRSVQLCPISVSKTPTIEEASAYCGALPSNEHPSDHVPISAKFEVSY
jgi:mRNA deadenylase 3'-5' endonuclease subunit Ccr4